MKFYHIHLICILLLFCILCVAQILSYLSIDEELTKILMQDTKILRHQKLKNSSKKVLPTDIYYLKLFNLKEERIEVLCETVNKKLQQLQRALMSVDRTHIFLSVPKQTIQRYITINQEVQRLDERMMSFSSSIRKQKTPAIAQNDFHEIFKETQHLTTAITALQDEILDKVRTEISWQQDFVIIGPLWLPLLVPVIRVLQVTKKHLTGTPMR
jgi:hypothetical protein